MRELDNKVIKHDTTNERATLELSLTGNFEAIGFITEVLECLIDSCQKKWEKKGAK